MRKAHIGGSLEDVVKLFCKIYASTKMVLQGLLDLRIISFQYICILFAYLLKIYTHSYWGQWFLAWVLIVFFQNFCIFCEQMLKNFNHTKIDWLTFETILRLCANFCFLIRRKVGYLLRFVLLSFKSACFYSKLCYTTPVHFRLFVYSSIYM